MLNDLLTPRERIGLLLIDEIPDRVVTYPLITSHSATVSGCTVAEYCTNGKTLAYAQITAWRLYHHDAISIFTDVGLIAETFGSQYAFRPNDIPILIEPALSDIRHIDRLTIPDIESAGRIPVYKEAIERCYDSVGEMVPIIAFIPAPFTTAAQIRGIAPFLRDTIRFPQEAHRLLQISTEVAQSVIDVCMERGALPMLVDPLASNSVISPITFTRFALPYTAQLMQYMHHYDLDTMLHICGETELILDAILTVGADLFSFDKNAHDVTREKLGTVIRLIGNIKPNDLLFGSPKQIYETVKQTVLALKDSPKGFVIATGCEVPIATPKENVEAFISAAHTYGTYWEQ
jgi:uroporphyrinogen decarboxylase